MGRDREVIKRSIGLEHQKGLIAEAFGNMVLEYVGRYGNVLPRSLVKEGEDAIRLRAGMILNEAIQIGMREEGVEEDAVNSANVKQLRRWVRHGLRVRSERLSGYYQLHQILVKPRLRDDLGLDAKLLDRAYKEFKTGAWRFVEGDARFGAGGIRSIEDVERRLLTVLSFTERASEEYFRDYQANRGGSSERIDVEMFRSRVKLLRALILGEIMERRVGPLYMDYQILTDFVAMVGSGEITSEKVGIAVRRVVDAVGIEEGESQRVVQEYVTHLSVQVFRSAKRWITSPKSKHSTPDTVEYWRNFFGYFDVLPPVTPRPDVDFIFGASVLARGKKDVPHLWVGSQKWRGVGMIPSRESLIVGMAMLEAGGNRGSYYYTKLEEAVQLRDALKSARDRHVKIERYYVDSGVIGRLKEEANSQVFDLKNHKYRAEADRLTWRMRHVRNDIAKARRLIELQDRRAGEYARGNTQAGLYVLSSEILEGRREDVEIHIERAKVFLRELEGMYLGRRPIKLLTPDVENFERSLNEIVERRKIDDKKRGRGPKVDSFSGKEELFVKQVLANRLNPFIPWELARERRVSYHALRGVVRTRIATYHSIVGIADLENNYAELMAERERRRAQQAAFDARGKYRQYKQIVRGSREDYRAAREEFALRMKELDLVLDIEKGE